MLSGSCGTQRSALRTDVLLEPRELLPAVRGFLTIILSLLTHSILSTTCTTLVIIVAAVVVVVASAAAAASPSPLKRSYSDQGSHGPKPVGHSQWTAAVLYDGDEGGLSARTQSRLPCKPMLAIGVGTPVQEPPANAA